MPGFDKDFFETNRQRLREAFGGHAPIVISANGQLQKSMDSVYPFRQDSNFWYLTGVNEPGLVLVIDRDKEYLILPRQSQYMKTFDGEIDATEIKLASGIRKVYDFETGWNELGKRLRKSKHVAGIEAPESFIEELDMYTNPARARLEQMVFDQNPKLKFVDLKKEMADLRMIKRDPEIRAIRKATKATMEAFVAISKKLKHDRSEYDMAAIATAYFLRRKMSHAYEPIVASGDNATVLHYVENSERVKASELVLIDIGAEWNHYASDITRTIAINPTKRQQQVHQAVKEANEFAVGLVKPGITNMDLEQKTREFLGEKLKELGLVKRSTKSALRRYYPHATSHFVGLDVHDPMQRDTVLEPGMVLTVEPGLYIKEEGIGVRIEDIVLVKPNGHESLSGNLSHGVGSLKIKKA